MKTLKFEKGFLTVADKKAIKLALSNLLTMGFRYDLAEEEVKIIYHNKTRLEIKKSEYSIDEYSVSKSVNGGSNYCYNSYFKVI